MKNVKTLLVVLAALAAVAAVAAFVVTRYSDMFVKPASYVKTFIKRGESGLDCDEKTEEFVELSELAAE